MTNLEEAVEDFLAGDRSAFQKLVDATSTRLVRLSARMLGNMTDAEDAVQEAYVKAYRSLLGGQFDRRSRVETWLYRIVVNTSIDAKRARGRRIPQADVLVAPSWDGGASADARLALAELADWLDDLPEEQSTAIILKAVEGLGAAEIAEILQCSEGAVEQRLVRARTTLKQRRDES